MVRHLFRAAFVGMIDAGCQAKSINYRYDMTISSAVGLKRLKASYVHSVGLVGMCRSRGDRVNKF